MPTRSRRRATEPIPVVSALSRDAEMAYIRADMRRLIIIGAGLLALMLVILVLAGR